MLFVDDMLLMLAKLRAGLQAQGPLASAKIEHQFDCVPVPLQFSLVDMGTITE